MWLPVIRTWRLNERHYGALTGLNKAETAAKHGEAQVKIWRRSYDIPPPPMQSDHPFYSTISKVRPIGLHLPCWDAPKSHLRSLQCGLDSSARSLSPLQQLGLWYTVLAGVGLSLSHFLPREVEPLGIAHRCKAEETTPLLMISPVNCAHVCSGLFVQASDVWFSLGGVQSPKCS